MAAQIRGISQLGGAKHYQPLLCFNQFATLLQPKLINKKQHITEAQKDGKFPFLDSQKKSKSIASKMIKFGVFPELNREKKMCVDVKTVCNPDSGCFLIISALTNRIHFLLENT